MIDKFKIAQLKTDYLTEGIVSSQLRPVISQWVAFAVRYYSDWNKRPNCGFFFSGAYNYGVETSATIMVTAAAAVFGSYDEEVIKVPKKRLIEMTVRSIRYLCFTHHTGPADCVRNISRNPVTSGKKWGHTPGNFFMSSQTGVSVSMLGLASWLLWDKLDAETRDMVSRVLVFYADEFCDMTPGTGAYNDTQCEENAWTSLGISAALYMFPNHPHSDRWRDGYINWSLNSVTTYKDKLENELDKVTGKSRGGFEYKGRKYGISSVTFHPDFTTENHGYVHPDYMGAGIILRTSSSVFPLLMGEKPLGSLLHNFDNLYNKVIKPWCAADGNPIPVQGQDWYYHKHHNKLIMHAAMNLFFNDEDAAMFERHCIDIMSRRQKSNGNGRLIEKNGENLEVTLGTQSAFDMEYGAIRTVVLSYIMHLALGDGVAPASMGKVMDKLSGNHKYPYGGVYIYRTRDTFASYTTRCSIMGLSIPADGIWDITTDFQSFTGIIRENSPNDKYFAGKKINWKDMGFTAVKEHVEEYDAGFSAMTDVPRAGGSILQKSSFSALPDGRVLYVEKVIAAGDVDIGIYETGKISIGNENFKSLPELAGGCKDVFFNGTKKRFYGNYDGDDIKYCQDDVRYINIDNKIGYLVYGSNKAEYLNRHIYPKWKGLEDTLVLNKREPFSMYKGDETDIFAVVSLPNFNEVETKMEYGITSVTHVSKNLFVIRTGDYRISINFSDNDASITERVPIKDKKAGIFNGLTALDEKETFQEYCVKGFSTRIDNLQGAIQFDDDSVDLKIACSEGRISIMNSTGQDAIYTFISGTSKKRVFHSRGDIISLP